MTEADRADGYVMTLNGRKVLRFVRYLDRPVEKVWAALVVPERVADWLGRLEIEPRVGGRYNLVFGDDGSRATGIIQDFDPPRRLAYTWGDNTPDPEHPGVVFEVAPDGTGSRLTLTTQFPKDHPGDPAEAVATWHEFLRAIPLAVDGQRMPWDAARRMRWTSLFEPYRTILASAGLVSAVTRSD
ncbi:MAG TPA: SRPBCC domain-containing protein [Alphaproteobacteria bacterium]|nr:SRPBCC domain-containing protein [Alphaproteobacteria bacterium]